MEEPNATAGDNRAEAERLLGIADKLLQGRDLNGSRDFAILAQETEPLLDGSDQILAVADVLIAAEKRINNHHDWYSIIQIDRRSDDLDLIKKQYRRLALLLHPDKNKFAFSDHAFKLVADAWAVLSDPAKKSLYDNELSLFAKVDLKNERQRKQEEMEKEQKKLPVRRSQRAVKRTSFGDEEEFEEDLNDHQAQAQTDKLSSFWTACPYCYILYEYPRVYEGCCLRCQNCQRAFHAALIPTLPPVVVGKEAYYCCWGFFPLGFAISGSENAKGAAGFPNWMPPVFSTTPGAPAAPENAGGGNYGGGAVDISDGSASAGVEPRRRGRPPKNRQVFS